MKLLKHPREGGLQNVLWRILYSPTSTYSVIANKFRGNKRNFSIFQGENSFRFSLDGFKIDFNDKFDRVLKIIE